MNIFKGVARVLLLIGGTAGRQLLTTMTADCVTCGPLYTLEPQCASRTEAGCAAIGAVVDGCCARDCCTLSPESAIMAILMVLVFTFVTSAVSAVFFTRAALLLRRHRESSTGGTNLLGEWVEDDLPQATLLPPALVPRRTAAAAAVEMVPYAVFRATDNALPIATLRSLPVSGSGAASRRE